MKLSLILLVLILGGAGATWFVRGGMGGEESASGIPTEGLFEARRGVLTVTITENGQLVAKESRKISADTRGQAKITELVEEGTLVEEGDVLVKFDPTETEDRFEQREMEIVTAEANLASAQIELEIQETDNVATAEKAVIALDKARKEDERYREGDAPKARRDLEVKIKEAETAFTRAKKTFEDSKILVEKEYINRSQFEDDAIAFERAELQLEGAIRDLELFDQYNFPMMLTEKEVAIKDADRELTNAKKRGEASMNQKQANVDKNEMLLNKLQDQRDELMEELEKMTLKAPGPGLVIHGDPRRPWDRDRIRVGGEVWGSMVLMTIPDLRVMQVKLRIHEADVNKLEVGQTAKVSMDTYPGLIIDGEVTKIDTIAKGDDPWDDDPEVKKFTVEVTLQATGEVELKPGISAKAEIFIDRLEDVLYVPIQSVFLEEGQHWVYIVAEDGQPTAVPVQPGLANDSYIEILDGIGEGQQVLLYNPNLPTGELEGVDDGDAEDGEPGPGDGVEDGDGAMSTTAS